MPTPESPILPLSIFYHCVENDVENKYDGGKVLLQMVNGQKPEIAEAFSDSRLLLQAKHDEIMRQFAPTRADKNEQFFKITIELVSYADLPPDPNAPPELFNKDGQRVNEHGDLLK